jgi:hypothetical protein
MIPSAKKIADEALEFPDFPCPTESPVKIRRILKLPRGSDTLNPWPTTLRARRRFPRIPHRSTESPMKKINAGSQRASLILEHDGFASEALSIRFVIRAIDGSGAAHYYLSEAECAEPFELVDFNGNVDRVGFAFRSYHNGWHYDFAITRFLAVGQKN